MENFAELSESFVRCAHYRVCNANSPAAVELFARNCTLTKPRLRTDDAYFKTLHLIYFVKSVASSQSVSSLLTNGKAIYGGDVNAPTVKMKNCMVCGSIYGTEVRLENCVVLGGVFSSRSLTITGSMVGTFNSPEVNASGVNYLLYPTAFSVEPMSFLPGTEFWNLSLADLGSLFKGEDEKPNTGKIKIDFENDTQRTVLTDENGTQTLINSYSVASRVLVSDLINMEKMEKMENRTLMNLKRILNDCRSVTV